MTEQRRRTYSWPDPATITRNHHGASGLAFVRAMAADEVPGSPASHTLGFHVADAAEGFAELVAAPGEWALNSGGSVHGGIVGAWCDSALGYAIATTLPAGVGYTTIDLTTRYLRPVFPADGPFRVTGRTEHTGRRTATARAEVVDARGRLMATSTTTMMLFRD